MLSPPRLPLAIRALNTGMGVLDRLGAHPPALSMDKLLATASRRTGLDDFGENSFRKGLKRLLLSLSGEAQLSPMGRIIARQDLLMALSNRLQLIEYHRLYSDIGAGTIERPIFIIGMGRSGTTILHELLGLDENLRLPQTWEVDQPFPPPCSATYSSDPRIEACQKNLDRTDFILPDFKRIHRMGATLPQECVRWTTGEFASMIYWTTYDVPGYADWLMNEADLAPAYRYHRRFLQLLQWQHPASQWILKSPGHLWSLEALLTEYPDARFIQTHRDPLKILTSLSSLVTALRKMASDHVDPCQIAREWARWNARGLNASASFRKRGQIAMNDIIDISFYDFMDQPLKQIEAIYSQFDLELAPETRTRMQHYLATHTTEQHGSHDYRFEDTGLDKEEERERVNEYQDYFDVKMEVL